LYVYLDRLQSWLKRRWPRRWADDGLPKAATS
jgi:hypothetical protein